MDYSRESWRPEVYAILPVVPLKAFLLCTPLLRGSWSIEPLRIWGRREIGVLSFYGGSACTQALFQFHILCP